MAAVEGASTPALLTKAGSFRRLIPALFVGALPVPVATGAGPPRLQTGARSLVC